MGRPAGNAAGTGQGWPGAGRELFPRHLETLGDERNRIIVRLGLAQARSHRLDAERSARVYIDLMFLLGSGFAGDPQLPWARAILEDPSLVEETTRVDFLYDQAMEHVDRCADDIRALVDGPDRPRFSAEIASIQQEPNEPFDPADTAALERRIAARLRAAFPRKGGVLGMRARDVGAAGAPPATKAAMPPPLPPGGHVVTSSTMINNASSTSYDVCARSPSARP